MPSPMRLLRGLQHPATSFRGAVLVGGAWAALAIVGCGERAPSAKPAPAPAPSTAGAEAESVAQVPPLDVAGHWVRFWAPVGQVQTQHYVFLPDGRYGWAAADGSQTTSGQYRVADSTLLLREQSREEGAPPAPEQALELGACPPNDEAQAIDSGYRCLAIGGQAFFRRGDVTPELEQSFFR